MRKLHISADISLPLDLATQTVAILARKRVGKTYTASVMAEELIKAEIPIVVLDPTGAWWGLRSSADGKHEGFPVVIIGGAHADIPLEEHAGKIIADLVVDHPGYYVIDFSQLETDASVRRFAQDFGARFYFRKEEKRFPIHLIIDEADVFCPQQPFADQKKLVHVYDVIVRRGGIRGIGVTMISQRPAVLNKNILTQCETLITLQISGSQDVDAIEHWIRLHGSKEERDEFLGSIASLRRGEAWIWSPSWLEAFKLIHIRERETFNSSATPKAGEKIIVPQKLAPVDIAKLGVQIRESAERIKENDPTELRARLKKAYADLEKAIATRPMPQQIYLITQEEKVLLNSTLEVCRNAEKQAASFSQAMSYMRAECEKITSKLGILTEQNSQQIRRSEIRQSTPPPIAKPHEAQSHNGELGKCERAILQALANSNGTATKKKIAVFAGYSVSGGSFNNALGKLRGMGVIDRGDPIQILIPNYLPPVEVVTGSDLYARWMLHPELGKAERKILETLYVGGTLEKEELADRTGYEASGGSFNNALGRLRTLELINRGSPIRLAEEFRP